MISINFHFEHLNSSLIRDFRLIVFENHFRRFVAERANEIFSKKNRNVLLFSSIRFLVFSIRPLISFVNRSNVRFHRLNVEVFH